MRSTNQPALDKNTARGLIEDRLRRIGVKKGELSRALFMSASVFSRKLGARHPYECFSADEVNRIAAFLGMDEEQRLVLLLCHGHLDARAVSGNGAGRQVGYLVPTASMADRPAAAPATRADAVVPKRSLPVPGNLPAPLTSFVGRERERAEVKRLLATTRLLTLTGTGGCGKTRLALVVAAGLTASYPDGVWLVELAPLFTPDLVPRAIAGALGIRETAGTTITETLMDALRSRRMLLVLDNCEHLVSDCARIAEMLLRAAPEFQILATSREALAIPGETTLRVPSLSVPLAPQPPALPPAHHGDPLREDPGADFRGNPAGLPRRAGDLPLRGVRRGGPADLPLRGVRRGGPADLQGTGRGDRLHAPPLFREAGDRPGEGTASEAEALFVERVRSVQPGFALTGANAEAVAQISRRLDGIPLAIELAAARVTVLSVDQIADRLDDCFRLLTEGSRTALPRQQTLRAAMDWSHDLLDEPERAVFRRLAVFAGGFTLEAAEEVTEDREQGTGNKEEAGSPPTVPCSLFPVPSRPVPFLDLLARLVRKSLVVVEEQDTVVRYRLLEPVRQYAAAKLREAAETAVTRQRHLHWYLALAEQAEPALIGPGRELWMDRLEQEHDNLRAALGWSITDGNDSAAGLRLSAALWRFWQEHGYLGEGRRWLDSALSAGGAAPAALRAKALNGAGVLAREQGDYDRATALYSESLALWRDLGDKRGTAATLNSLGMVVRDQGNVARAKELYEEALALRRELDDRHSIAATLNNLALLMGEQGDHRNAVRLYEESLALKRELGDRRGIAATLNNLGMLAREQGNHARAAALYTDSLALFRELGDTWGVGVLLNNLGRVARDRGDYRRAAALHTESLALRRDLGDKPGIAWCLEGLAAVACGEGRPERAAMLLGAAEALRDAIGAAIPLAERAGHHRTLAAARAALDEHDFAMAWARGRAMTLDQAIARALEEPAPVS
jgi:predicted ATPase